MISSYCVPGTVGARVLAGEKQVGDASTCAHSHDPFPIQIELPDARAKVDVKMQVKHLSFSAHADAKGIMQLIKQCKPDNVILVHGEASKMYGWLLLLISKVRC